MAKKYYVSKEARLIRSKIDKINQKQKRLRNSWLELDIIKTALVKELELHGVDYGKMANSAIVVNKRAKKQRQQLQLDLLKKKLINMNAAELEEVGRLRGWGKND